MARPTEEYLGQYRLTNLLRTGKTCQVWEAINDVKGQQRFAVKLLVEEYRTNKDELGYFKREYEVGKMLDNPRCIRIYDFGADQKNVYLAMELFQSPNVKQLIQQGHEDLFPLLQKFIMQAAEGLAHLHSKGWIHRDIKPDNFLMSPKGEVKLIDFALAHRRRTGLARFLPDFSKKAAIQGTRSYMSPEQIRNESLDERADVYSFGCMLHELAGGKLPFTGTSTNDLLMKHLKAAPPPLQSANRNVTDAFAALVKRMLAKKPSDRPASMVDFMRDFQGMQIFKETPGKGRAGGIA